MALSPMLLSVLAFVPSDGFSLVVTRNCSRGIVSRLAGVHVAPGTCQG